MILISIARVRIPSILLDNKQVCLIFGALNLVGALYQPINPPVKKTAWDFNTRYRDHTHSYDSLWFEKRYWLVSLTFSKCCWNDFCSIKCISLLLVQIYCPIAWVLFSSSISTADVRFIISRIIRALTRDNCDLWSITSHDTSLIGHKSQFSCECIITHKYNLRYSVDVLLRIFCQSVIWLSRTFPV